MKFYRNNGQWQISLEGCLRKPNSFDSKLCHSCKLRSNETPFKIDDACLIYWGFPNSFSKLGANQKNIEVDFRVFSIAWNLRPEGTEEREEYLKLKTLMYGLNHVRIADMTQGKSL